MFRPATGRLPTLDDLSLGNRSTKYNDLTWAKACAAKHKFDTATGWRKLVPSMTVSYGADPHAPMKHMDWPDPCAPNAVKRALGEARRLVEEDGNIFAAVSGRMRYTAGGDQPGHHASWSLGEYAREGSMFAGAVRSRRKLPSLRRVATPPALTLTPSTASR
ncbi:MAG: hypothetical protein IPJ61_18760 [Tessaracoccus sp.]|uniref:hypothetical protein n=1 Tax=Tessaracoccus sp. TaxID=1971211 RepID=UPI001EC912F8|nr:hypothetical protein [Tessaracoccus sp.]MBK7823027.1 hypothetical protein [Tessaracoccus sp.]